MKNRNLNWKRQPEDNRDFILKKSLKIESIILPALFELPLQIPIYDQGQLGSCTANSGCACFRFESAQVLGNFGFDPSRLFLYYNTREIMGTVGEDSGAYIRDTFKALNKKGVSWESSFPYIENKFTQTPTNEAYNEGSKNIAIRYASIPQNETSIKQTLFAGGAISFGFDVFNSFMGEWEHNGGLMPIPGTNESLLGGHAVTIIGWDDTSFGSPYFLIQNSWGTTWGNMGKFWMPASYLLGSHCSDFWVIEEISTPKDEPTGDNSLSYTKEVFQTSTELKRLKKSSIVRLGNLLGLAVNSKMTFSKIYSTIKDLLGL